MSENYAVFIGDVAQDEYYLCDHYPQLKEKVLCKMLEPQMGGMIANAACVFSAYGNRTKFLSILNSGDITRKLCKGLNSFRIDTNLIVYDDTLADSKCLIFLAEGENTCFTPERGIEKFEISRSTQKVLCKAEIIYSNYCELQWMCCGDLSATDLLAEWYKSGVKLCCDIDVDEIDLVGETFLPYTHILFMNELGFSRQRKSLNDQDASKRLLGLGVKILVVTLAEKGCVIFTKEDTVRIPGINMQVVDVTGAGDTFCSTFTDLISKGGDIRVSGTFANYAAALSITAMGPRSGAIGYHPVLDFMKSNGVDIQPYLKFIA